MFVTACLPQADAPPLHRWGRGTLLPAGPDAAVAMTAAHAEVAPPLEEIAVPALVVHVAKDAIVPPATAQEVATRIPGAQLFVLGLCRLRNYADQARMV